MGDVHASVTYQNPLWVPEAESDPDVDELCAQWASEKCTAPKCVCRSSLQRVDGLQRAILLRQQLGLRDALSEEELEQWILSGDFIICDCCEKRVPLSKDSFVWTCENRNCTILHATSYDICEKCFVQHT